MQQLLQNGVFPNPVTNRNRKSIFDVYFLTRSTNWLTVFLNRPRPMQLSTWKYSSVMTPDRSST